MSYHDLRKGRFSEANRSYFVTTVTHERERLFDDLYCARIVINAMKELDDQDFVCSLSWVVMHDHLHWLFQLGDKASLSIVMKRLKATSARSINKHLGRQGSVWQKAYHDRAVRDGEDIRQLARYIVGNPLRAGLVGDLGGYSHWDAVWL